jgi:sortase A
MRDWVGRWGGFGLIFAGWLLLTGLIPSAAGPADVVREAIGGQPQPPAAVPGRPPTLPLLPASPRQGPLGEATQGTHGAHAGHGGQTAPATPSAVPATPAAVPATETAPEAGPEVPPQDSAVEAPPAPGGDAPPSGTERIAIPRIGVDARVVDVGLLPSGEMETAAHAAGRLAFSAQAGEAGNAVIAGHNDIDGEVFRRLPELRQGDEILLQRGDRTFRYLVVVRTIVREQGATAQQRYENARWMDPTEGPTATLISCYPYRVDTHRVIVHAVMVAG